MDPNEEAEAAAVVEAPEAAEAEAAEGAKVEKPLARLLKSLMSHAYDAPRRAMSSLAAGPQTIWMATS